MNNQNISKLEALIEKGVKIPNPHSIEIGDEVNIDKISGSRVVIHSGCKIYGSSTLIHQGVQLGYEAPATIENCQIGPDVELKGGFFRQAVFLKKASMGSGSHVREGTILEEQASGAHTVGLKQTILFPFVTLGSLINFCDCFMSGGTSRKNHSEVGSSYIHFNFSANQDKATPSLIGDVPSGVMLNQMPIFLGGQGGLVGPCRLAFGTVIAAGSIFRKDELKPGYLLFEGGRTGSMPFTPGMYLGVPRILKNNIVYIANLMGLRQWYEHVRSQFISDDFSEALFDGLKEKLDMGINERIKQLKKLCERLNTIAGRWPEMEESISIGQNEQGDTVLRDAFLEKIHNSISNIGKDYITVIKELHADEAAQGTRWVQGIVDHISAEILKIIS